MYMYIVRVLSVIMFFLSFFHNQRFLPNLPCRAQPEACNRFGACREVQRNACRVGSGLLNMEPS